MKTQYSNENKTKHNARHELEFLLLQGNRRCRAASITGVRQELVLKFGWPLNIGVQTIEKPSMG